MNRNYIASELLTAAKELTEGFSDVSAKVRGDKVFVEATVNGKKSKLYVRELQIAAEEKAKHKLYDFKISKAFAQVWEGRLRVVVDAFANDNEGQYADIVAELYFSIDSRGNLIRDDYKVELDWD